jgi:hypothetical protein
MDEMSGADIFSYSQIIQGVLIFLSAIVGLGGYVVQGKIKSRETQRQLARDRDDERRQLQLTRLRDQMAKFIGPASALSNAFWMAWWRLFGEKSKFGFFAGSPSDARFGNTLFLNDLTGGKIARYLEEDVCMTISTFVNGQLNEMESWVGPEVEREIRQDPTSKVAAVYFAHVRLLFKRYLFPLRDLFQQFAGFLWKMGDSDEFKAKYPSAAASGWLRNLFWLQLVNHCNEMEDIVIPAWDRGDFSLLFPAVHPFPVQLGMHLTRMLTELRQEESALGAANHTTMALDSDMKRGHKHKEKEKEKEKKNTKGEKVTKEDAGDRNQPSKYATEEEEEEEEVE